MKLAKEAAFWAAVGLTGAVTVALLKILAGRVKLPSGLTDVIGAL